MSTAIKNELRAVVAEQQEQAEADLSALITLDSTLEKEIPAQQQVRNTISGTCLKVEDVTIDLYALRQQTG